MKTFKTPKGTELPLLNLKGKDYLQVAHRLVWFREEKPDWTIKTSFVSISADYAIAKAEILTAQGLLVATAHKSEDKKGFFDFIEKAETGAIGRALALCGYGTQFCAEELDEGKRIVDSPVFRGKNSVVAPEQPEEGDGVQTQGYRVPGHLDKRIAAKMVWDCDPKILREVVAQLDKKYEDKDMPEKALEFVTEASNVIAYYEKDQDKKL